jgi:hypothetical protein
MSAGKIEVYPAPFDLDEVLHALAAIMSINVVSAIWNCRWGLRPMCRAR